jgi:hypothetical protein
VVNEERTSNDLRCADVEELISGLIDGELDRETRLAAERHIQACPTCRDMVAAAEELNRTVGELRQAVQPGGFPAHLRAGILAEVQGAERQAGTRVLPFPRVRTWSGWAVAASLALMMAVAAVTGWFGPPRSMETDQASVRVVGVEREAFVFVRMLSRWLGGDLTEEEYATLISELQAPGPGGGPNLLFQLLGENGRSGLRDLADRTDLSPIQQQFLREAERLIESLEAGEQPDQDAWRRLHVGLAAFRLG